MLADFEQAKIIAPDEVLFGVIRTMADMDTPALFWAEYTPPKLVHSMFLSEWTVATSVEPVKRVFPRRWIDIRGMKMMDLWEAALRAVMGVVLFRPGISQVRGPCHLWQNCLLTAPSRVNSVGTFATRTTEQKYRRYCVTFRRRDI